MTPHSNCDSALQNHLLATMPICEFGHISPLLEQVSLTAGQVLNDSGDKSEYVYFPTTALITLLHLTRSGTTVGVGMIGSEGILGIEAFSGAGSSPSLAIVQNAGIAYRMRTGDFRAGCDVAPVFRISLLRYMQGLFNQVSQTATCNRFHSVSQRYARWLLESLDRLGCKRLVMTHEQMAGSLGTRRASITTAAHNFAILGLIKVRRGSVTILDRPGLEFAACECYELVSFEYNRLLGRKLSERTEDPGPARDSAEHLSYP